MRLHTKDMQLHRCAASSDLAKAYMLFRFMSLGLVRGVAANLP